MPNKSKSKSHKAQNPVKADNYPDLKCILGLLKRVIARPALR